MNNNPSRGGSRNAAVRTEDILHISRSSTWRFLHKLRLLSLSDLLYSTELTALWRRHLVWSHKDGKELLEIVTGRFASTQIFLSLLFAAEVGTYFSPSRIVTDVRNALRTGPHVGKPLEYATGILLIISIILTGSAVLANYTALGVFRCLSRENAAIVLRSDVGLYAAQLPSRLTFLSIISFFAWNGMFVSNKKCINEEANTATVYLIIMSSLIIILQSCSGGSTSRATTNLLLS
jgi:hypothetical protein